MRPRRVLALLASLGSAVLVLPGGISGGNPLAADSSLQDDRPGFVRQQMLDFAGTVALSRDGNTAIVARPRANEGRGEAAVFTRSGTRSAWRKLTELRGGGKKASFGTSAALSADGRTVVIGASGENDGKGAAWIFTPRGGGVSVGQKLTGRGMAGAAGLGGDVALASDGKTALVGGKEDGGTKGAAWVFIRSGSAWKQHGGKLVARGLKRSSRFGTSVALSGSGDVALVGAPGHNTRQGAAWAFTRTPSAWRERATLQLKPVLLRPTEEDWSDLGRSVALSGNGDTALVGGPRYGEGRGAVFRFTDIRSGSPRQAGQLSPPTTPTKPRSLGNSVALSADGKTALIAGNQTWAFGRATQSSWDKQSLPGGNLALAGDGYTALIALPGTRDRPRGESIVFVVPPVVTAMQPPFGPTGGGTEVTITGRRFTRVRSVWFGSKPATSYTVEAPSRIRAVSPGEQAGAVDVTISTSVGTSRPMPFTYFAGPVVTAVTPVSGPTDGGTQVTITGGAFVQVSAVRFGASAASTFTVDSPTQIRAVAPPGQAGAVDVTVTAAGGVSPTSAADRFTYLAVRNQTIVTFDNLVTGGPGGAGALVVVNAQYASQGVTFNDVSAIDYEKGPSAVPGFARSGTIAIEQCVGVEFCTAPIRATFSAAQRMVRVWVGSSFTLNQPVQVRLNALNAANAVVGTATATLPASSSPTPIRTPLEVRLTAARIMRFEVSIPGGYTNALAVDHVTFERP